MLEESLDRDSWVAPEAMDCNVDGRGVLFMVPQDASDKSFEARGRLVQLSVYWVSSSKGETGGVATALRATGSKLYLLGDRKGLLWGLGS